jgi:hypothetical protein
VLTLHRDLLREAGVKADDIRRHVITGGRRYYGWEVSEGRGTTVKVIRRLGLDS